MNRRDAERELLAAALAGVPVRVDAAGAIDIQQAEKLADALLPAVDRIADQRVAQLHDRAAYPHPNCPRHGANA